VTEAELARHHRRLQLGTLGRRMSGKPAPDWPLDLGYSLGADTPQELMQRVAIAEGVMRRVRRLLFSSSGDPARIQSSRVSAEGRSPPGCDMAASCPVAATRHKPVGGSAGHRWLLGVLRRLRQVPPLIAVVEPAATAVPLQCNTEVVRSDRHPELPRQVIEDFVGRGAVGMCLHGLQRRIA
jgi:hypothetical protein